MQEDSDAGAVSPAHSPPVADPVKLTGVPASPGSVVAQVKVVGKNTSPESFPQGAVLVSRTTDPTLITFMLRASAIVTEIGSRMCHTAIVALEMGVPCVVAIDSLLTTLSDGMLIRVDGTSGVVTILEPRPEPPHAQ